MRHDDDDDTQDPDDGELLSMLDRLNLRERAAAEVVVTPPRTPPPLPQSPSTLPPRHTFPSTRARTYTTPNAERSTIYHIQSPNFETFTRHWSTAGAATQGVAGAHVHAVQMPSPSKYKHSKKAAYVVFVGTNYGVFLTWAETRALVNGVSGCIFRGYTTLAEARAAFAYAEARQWIRIAGTPPTVGIDVPQPNMSYHNPLNGNETLDSLWYVVYRGIFPGVYRSHLECQLNTLGVPGSLFESVVGQARALAKFARATHLTEVDVAPAPAYSDSDPFL
ncbi:hypothetical protein C8R43DRAFT_1127201 [Mycena crocata]|nr:hypothetical protein C8R43DRAFT_1127201 [Mycena crocata]